MGLTVGQVARLAGVTVRTLHHYDQVGLLRPGQRTASGYRRYTEPDLERLQQILFYRELGFPLEEITVILDEPGTDAVTHLRRQRELLVRRRERLKAMVAAVDRALEAHKMGISLTPQERLEVFGDFRPEDHEAEAQERWGGTEAFEQSRRRTAAYTKADWEEIKAQAGRTTTALAEAFAAGEPADGAHAMDLAEAHRAHISRWFYECTYEIHRGLGDMYVADPRFARNYETVAQGLAAYVRAAIHANAERAEA
jgi:DNA-binding transcriptional MerR regulator